MVRPARIGDAESGLRLEPEEFTLMAINGRGETRATQQFWEETHDHAARFAIN
jgi:hypothetical protein